MQHGRLEREWLELVGDLMSHPVVALPAERLALQLCATFEARACSFTDIERGHLRTGEIWPLSEPLGGYRSHMDATVRTSIDRHPLVTFFARTGVAQPMQTAHVPPAIAGPDNLRWWGEVGGAMGCPDQLSLPLRLRPDGSTAFVIGREDAYRGSEMRTAALVWRLLIGLDRQVRAISGSRLDAAPAQDFRLTARELSVLGLLADGLTAAAIGRRLGVRDRTAHKHLEHIYTKLGVRDRLSAVLRARDAGILPRRPG
jgi:DNA-binding CsgD family transcriptional regulator